MQYLQLKRLSQQQPASNHKSTIPLRSALMNQHTTKEVAVSSALLLLLEPTKLNHEASPLSDEELLASKERDAYQTLFDFKTAHRASTSPTDKKASPTNTITSGDSRKRASSITSTPYAPPSKKSQQQPTTNHALLQPALSRDTHQLTPIELDACQTLFDFKIAHQASISPTTAKTSPTNTLSTGTLHNSPQTSRKKVALPINTSHESLSSTKDNSINADPTSTNSNRRNLLFISNQCDVSQLKKIAKKNHSANKVDLINSMALLRFKLASSTNTPPTQEAVHIPQSTQDYFTKNVNALVSMLQLESTALSHRQKAPAQVQAKAPQPTKPTVQLLNEPEYRLTTLLSQDSTAQSINLFSTETNASLHRIFNNLETHIPPSSLSINKQMHQLQSIKSIHHLAYLSCAILKQISMHPQNGTLIPIAFISEQHGMQSMFSSVFQFSQFFSKEDQKLLLICAAKIYSNPTVCGTSHPYSVSFSESDSAISKYKHHLHSIGLALHLLQIFRSICQAHRKDLVISSFKILSAAARSPKVTSIEQLLDISLPYSDKSKNPHVTLVTNRISSSLQPLFKQLLIELLPYAHWHAALHLDFSLWMNCLPPILYNRLSSQLSFNFDGNWSVLCNFMSAVSSPFNTHARIQFINPHRVAQSHIGQQNNICTNLTLALSCLHPVLRAKKDEIIIPFFNVAKEHFCEVIHTRLLKITSLNDDPECIASLLKHAVLASLYFLPSCNTATSIKDSMIWSNIVAHTALTTENAILINLGFSIRFIHHLLQALHTPEQTPLDPLQVLHCNKFSYRIPQASNILSFFNSLHPDSSFHSTGLTWLKFQRRQQNTYSDAIRRLTQPTAANSTDNLTSMTLSSVPAIDHNIRMKHRTANIQHPIMNLLGAKP